MQFMITTSDLEEITGLVNFIKTLGSNAAEPLPTMIPLGEYRREDKHLQGKYVGLARHLSSTNLAKLKKLRKEQGLEAALAWGNSIKLSTKLSEPKPKKNKHQSNGSKRWRKTCAWCESGFLAQQSRTRVCSKRCRDAEYRQRSLRKPITTEKLNASA